MTNGFKCTYIQDRFAWWLFPNRPFNINNEYTIELLFTNKNNGSCKILITNLKTQVQTILDEDEEYPFS